jgi:hypothetical protein
LPKRKREGPQKAQNKTQKAQKSVRTYDLFPSRWAKPFGLIELFRKEIPRLFKAGWLRDPENVPVPQPRRRLVNECPRSVTY